MKTDAEMQPFYKTVLCLVQINKANFQKGLSTTYKQAELLSAIRS